MHHGGHYEIDHKTGEKTLKEGPQITQAELEKTQGEAVGTNKEVKQEKTNQKPVNPNAKES